MKDTDLKHMAIMAVLVWVMVFIGGCSKYKVIVAALNNVNEECKDSIIYATIPMPEISSGIIQISMNQFVKANEGYRSWAVSIDEKAIELVDDQDMTPAKFATEIVAETAKVNEWWGSEFVRLVEPVFDKFKATNKLMDNCDREFIRKFCKQRLDYWNSIAFLLPIQRIAAAKIYRFLSNVLLGYANRDTRDTIATCALTREIGLRRSVFE